MPPEATGSAGQDRVTDSAARRTAGGYPATGKPVGELGLPPISLQHFHDADREGCAACQEPQLVVVTWEDTTNVAVWQPVSEVADMTGWTVQNVGWLVHEDEDCIIVAARQAFDAEPPQVGLAERIPKRAIVRQEAL